MTWDDRLEAIESGLNCAQFHVQELKKLEDGKDAETASLLSARVMFLLRSASSDSQKLHKACRRDEARKVAAR